jgi:predicted small lipoprotein YifL
MNRRPAYVLAAIALCLALSACGNKGPLVLPDKPADGMPAESTPVEGTSADGTPAQPAPAADDAKTPRR